MDPYGPPTGRNPLSVGGVTGAFTFQCRILFGKTLQKLTSFFGIKLKPYLLPRAAVEISFHLMVTEPRKVTAGLWVGSIGRSPSACGSVKLNVQVRSGQTLSISFSRPADDVHVLHESFPSPLHGAMKGNFTANNILLTPREEHHRLRSICIHGNFCTTAAGWLLADVHRFLILRESAPPRGPSSF